ncbi:MAG: M28 family peptidase [Clostridiaceae bacterium]
MLQIVHFNSIKNKRFIKPILLVLLVFTAIYLCMSQFFLPAVLSADADKNKFSGERAYQYLGQFASEPHYIGMKGHDTVRDTIIKELKDMGIEPEIQSTAALHGSSYGEVENIIFRIGGSEGNKTILITGHYDTAPGSDGAADDGMAVSCILESARAMMASGTLKNNIVFLLSDGEEGGLLGAKAFAGQHVWADEIDMVFNFDARGNDGVPFLYQTSEKNSWLISQYVKAVDKPAGSSILNDIYKNMPNITDFSVYNNKGITGLNFATGEGMNSYHNSFDNLNSISKKSIQQFGENMLSLIRYFGNLEQWNTGNGDSIFFSLFRSVMITYPLWVSYPLFGIALLLFLYTFISGLKRKNISVKGTLLGIGVSAAILLMSYFAGSMVYKLNCAITPNADWYLSNNDLIISIPCLIELILILFSCCLLIFQLARCRIKTYDLILGGYFFWMVPAAVTTLVLPGGSYIFTWSLLFNLIGFNLIVKKNNPFIGIPFSLPNIFLAVPIIYLIFIMLTLKMSGILSITITLMLIIFVPLIKQFGKRSMIIISSAVIIISGLITTSIYALNIHPSPESPAGAEVNYVLDKDMNDSRFISIYKPNEYSSQFLTGDVKCGSIDLPLYRSDVYYSKASVEKLAEPLMKAVSDVKSNDHRKLRLEVQSQRNAQLIYLQIENEVTIHEVLVNGIVQVNKTTKYDASTNTYYLILVNTKGNINDISFVTDESDVLKFEVFDISFELPDSLLKGMQFPGKDIADYGSKTIVVKRYVF